MLDLINSIPPDIKKQILLALLIVCVLGLLLRGKKYRFIQEQTGI